MADNQSTQEETVKVFDNESKTINTEHRQSNNFLSDFASGAIITGPTKK
ncbi:MAG: hypothetical protein LZF61_05875 [Nitrosomonas sp.]|nr:MAG: hypothetical protein LZF61_05875 [Nitrosomonas sp.]